MNYLAHAYLSFNNEPVLLGNMISDFVKGKKQFLYPPEIHKGILLHRAIDDYTDSHAVIQKAKAVFRPDYRLYSGAFIDVAFDHFLAIDKTEFADGSLYPFSQETYKKLGRQQANMPEAFKRMFYYMQSENWLYRYQTREGIYQSFGGLVKRAAYLHDSIPAIKVFNQHYIFLEHCFNEFWIELKDFAFNKYKELMNEGVIDPAL
ncbi:acyl carrier protein phosphodiesterase [Niabella aquatica]